MVDRVYRSDLPRLRGQLEKLRQDFLKVGPKTDWNKIRIQPLLKHLDSLDASMESLEAPRLRRGVAMFHSDLVYLRANVKELRKILESEKPRAMKALWTQDL